MSEAKYYAVFFDVAKPQIRKNALVLKVDKNKFANLLDECVPDKNVELRFDNGDVAHYVVESRQSFWTNEFDMLTGQDANCFITCVVKKI